MKTLSLILAAGVSALAFASAAQAADLIINEPAPVVPTVVETTNNWDGPFIGAFAGYGWGDLDLVDVPDAEVSPQGWLLGVSAGTNFTLSEGIVAGIVGDIAWADLNESVDDAAVGVAGESNIDWLGSVRGRIGFDGGAFLPYVTAGLAFAHNNIDGTFGAATVADDQTHIGWTAGAGVEFAATDNLSVDVLYRYSDYGTQSYAVEGGGETDVGLTSHTLSVGLNFGF